ncbi:hypothetical protein CsSME_00024090 [Camellia sinensis var. sinensis]
MNHSTPPSLFLQNISISFTDNRKRLATETLNTNLIIFLVETNKKVIDSLLGHHLLKSSGILRTSSLEVLIIIEFLPQTAQLSVLLSKRPSLLIKPVENTSERRQSKSHKQYPSIQRTG